MKKLLLILLSVSALIMAQSALALDDSDRFAKIHSLTERYSEAEKVLAEHRAEADRLANIGYGGPVLRKDLKILAGNIIHLIRELARLDKELEKLRDGLSEKIKLPPIGGITGSLGSYDGSPLEGSVKAGDIVAFAATAGFPSDAAPAERSLTWKVMNVVGKLLQSKTCNYDSGGKVVKEGSFKSCKPQKDSSYSAHVRFRLKNFTPGEYHVSLEHRLTDHPAVYVKSSYPFKVQGDAVLDDFKITATLNNYNGPPLTGSVSNGDTLAFQAEVKHPAAEPPMLTELYWQLYDAGGSPVEGFSKRIQALDSDTHAKFRFKLNNFENGGYKVALTHRLVENRDVFVQAVKAFTLFQAVKIKKLVVTADPKSQENRSTLYGDERPYFYVYYELGKGVDGVDVGINIRDSKTGETIISKSTHRERKKGNIQRIGFALKKGRIKTGSSAEFMVTLTSANGKHAEASTSFSVSNYALTLNIPGTLKSGKSRDFNIRVPSAFTPPYQVDIEQGRGLSIGHYKGSLNGTITGIAEESDLDSIVRVSVTDAQGRKGTAVTSVLVAARPKPDTYASTDDTRTTVATKSYWDYVEDKKLDIKECLEALNYSLLDSDERKNHYIIAVVNKDTKRYFGHKSIIFDFSDYYGLDYRNRTDGYQPLVRQSDHANQVFVASYTTNSLSEAKAFGTFICHHPDWALRDRGLTFTNPAINWPVSRIKNLDHGPYDELVAGYHEVQWRPIPSRPWR